MNLLIVLLQRNRYRQRAWYEQLFNFISELPWMWIFLVIIIIWALLKANKKDYHSHWSTSMSNFKYSTQSFYEQLSDELKSHAITGLKVKPTYLKEGNTFSYNRMYLQIDWKDYRYYVCLAPFGDGTFISSWLNVKTSLVQTIISRIPFVGRWLERTLFPTTFFTIDTAGMFMSYCHNSVLKVADDITKDSGFRISDSDRKPILKDIFKR